MTLAQIYELALLALCIWREARGETSPAKIAVGWSIRNRVSANKAIEWGIGWVGVILHPKQYSSFNQGDPNSTKFGLPADVSWQNSLTCANAVYLAQISDPTNGATHYYSGDKVPDWAPTMRVTLDIGNFHFLKAA